MDQEQIFDSNQNESIEMKCSMEANPPAKYTWLKDGLVTQFLFSFLMNLITVETNYRIEIFDQKCSSLEIPQANLKDTGSYKCIANNDFGNAAVTFIVNINGESIE